MVDLSKRGEAWPTTGDPEGAALLSVHINSAVQNGRRGGDDGTPLTHPSGSSSPDWTGG